MEKKQLFFSHTWKKDNLDRDNHKRVCELSKKLQACGWTTWIDEENLFGNIDAGMAIGIDNADAIIVCLTEAYCKKVNETANDQRKRDNCLKEWTYANARSKLMIPVVMEPALLNTSNWPPGIVSLYLGSTLYINACDENLNTAVISINNTLQQYGLYPLVNSNSSPSNSNSSPSNSNIKSLKTHSQIPGFSTHFKLSANLVSLIHAYYTSKSSNNRRNSEPPATNRLQSRLQNTRKRWRSTGNLRTIFI